MFWWVCVSEPATFAFLCHHASPLSPSPTSIPYSGRTGYHHRIQWAALRANSSTNALAVAASERRIVQQRFEQHRQVIVYLAGASPPTNTTHTIRTREMFILPSFSRPPSPRKNKTPPLRRLTRCSWFGSIGLEWVRPTPILSLTRRRSGKVSALKPLAPPSEKTSNELLWKTLLDYLSPCWLSARVLATPRP